MTSLTPNQQAIKRYEGATTVAAKTAIADPSVLNSDFTNFVVNWRPVNPATISLPWFVAGNYGRETFFRNAFSTTFHRVFSRTPVGPQDAPTLGAASDIMFRLAKNGSTWYLIFYAISGPNKIITLNAQNINVSSRHLTTQDGKYKVIFKTTGNKIGGAEEWNLQIAEFDVLVTSGYFYPITF